MDKVLQQYRHQGDAGTAAFIGFVIQSNTEAMQTIASTLGNDSPLLVVIAQALLNRGGSKTATTASHTSTGQSE
ncbi:hypothetical protein [Pseudomonas farsensis]|uniref:hypothetical protein n=1 Tax=Pseudomonas farsensis TaxID=2745492 RepID=UPI0030DD7110